MSGRKIFISYSRRDRDVVEIITKHFKEKGISFWKDEDNLEPGKPNWEYEIRSAIKQASAVVLIASPDALMSDYVQGELTIAKLHNKTIYPIWIRGHNWADCVPLDMIKFQYIDGRKSNLENAIKRLCITLTNMLDTSSGIIKLGLPSHDVVEVNIGAFNRFDHFLNHIYVQYALSLWFQPFKYGSEWVLGNIKTRQIAVPQYWSEIPRDKSLTDMIYEWGHEPVSEYGIVPDSYWGVWPAKRLPVVSVSYNSILLEATLLNEYSLREIIKLKQNKILIQVLDDFNVER
ncbi:MAG: toll/interleukin-1 receptor domain-containing protein, partial [Bacteroidota bacterium]